MKLDAFLHFNEREILDNPGKISAELAKSKQKEIGAIFGVVFSAVNQNRVRLKNKLKSSRKLKKHYDRILIQSQNMSNSKI